MMSLRTLALLPVAWGLVVLVLLLLTAGTPIAPGGIRAEIELGKVLSLLGLWAAAFTHDKGDYLRRAWFWIGLGIVCFLVRDLTLVPLGFDALPDRLLEALRGTLVLLGNVFSVAGIWMLAHAWKVGGIALPGGRRAQWIATTTTVVIAVALTGPGMVESWRRLWDGDLEMVVRLASTLGDTVSLALIAPLLLTALALRGGVFTWPWVFFSTGSLFWLLFDAIDLLAPDTVFSAHTRMISMEIIRALASGYIFAAGMAQRRAVLQMRRDADASS